VIGAPGDEDEVARPSGVDRCLDRRLHADHARLRHGGESEEKRERSAEDDDELDERRPDH